MPVWYNCFIAFIRIIPTRRKSEDSENSGKLYPADYEPVSVTYLESVGVENSGKLTGLPGPTRATVSGCLHQSIFREWTNPVDLKTPNYLKLLDSLGIEPRSAMPRSRSHSHACSPFTAPARWGRSHARQIH